MQFASVEGVPPSTYPLKALLGAGSAKMVCKILMSKSLEVKILRTKSLGLDQSRIARRHGLDHDCATSMASTRSDVTLGLWKLLGASDVAIVDVAGAGTATSPLKRGLSEAPLRP